VGKINHSSGIYCISKAIRHNKVLEGRGIGAREFYTLFSKEVSHVAQSV
jgi:hypothetical protein